MKLTFAVLTLGTLALGGGFLASCVVSPQRPAAHFSVPPRGPDEQAVAQAFEGLVRAYGRQDWDGVMDYFADDAQIESTASDAAGPDGVDGPRVLNKHEFGQAIKPIIASNRGYSVQNVTLMVVSPAALRRVSAMRWPTLPNVPTMAEQGVLLTGPAGDQVHLPCHPVTRAGDVGAGDTFTAAAAMAMAAGAPQLFDDAPKNIEHTNTIKAGRKIALPTRYPALTITSALSQVMVTASPPVSPSVVARILTIQKRSVTCGTFATRSDFLSLIVYPR